MKEKYSRIAICQFFFITIVIRVVELSNGSNYDINLFLLTKAKYINNHTGTRGTCQIYKSCRRYRVTT